jgi:hypothetical protein
MGSALVCFPQIAVLRSHISLHGFADNEVAHILELSVVYRITLCPKLSPHSPRTMLLHEFEERQILHNCHLDNFCNAMAQPSRVERLPEAPVSDCKHRWMVRSIEILIVKAITADTRGWARIDARDDGSAKHHVRGVPRVQRCGKTSNVCNHATTYNQQGLIATHTMVFHGNQDPLDICEVLVYLIAAEN